MIHSRTFRRVLNLGGSDIPAQIHASGPGRGPLLPAVSRIAEPQAYVQIV
jgi:hypothetical protein